MGTRDLLGVAAFAGMTEGERGILSADCRWVAPRPASVIFSQGDPADAVYAIVAGEGRVRIGVADGRSKALMVEVFHAGDIFGEMAVIDGSRRSATALADGSVQLARIGGPSFLAALAASPALGGALCRIMSGRLRRTFALLQDATFDGLEVRLARQIMYLGDKDGRRIEEGVRLSGRLRQGDLADLLGTTTRSIITVLNAWRTAGIVRYDGDRAILTILREADLRALIAPTAD